MDTDYLWALGAIFLVGLVTFAECSSDNSCSKKGGALLRTAFGYECVKVEKIPD